MSNSTPWGGPAANPASYPLAMTTRYEFAARGNKPPVTMFWYDGGLSPMILADVPRPSGDGGGAVFVGEKGYIPRDLRRQPEGLPGRPGCRSRERSEKLPARGDGARGEL